MKYHYSYSRLTYRVGVGESTDSFLESMPAFLSGADHRPEHILEGSLAGAAHLLQNNEGVQR